MASLLKHWRDSSSLIIASKKLSMPIPRQTFANKLLKKLPEVAENTNEEFLRVLLLKRHGNNSFMPNTFVFPGGMINENDFSEEWLDIIGSTQDKMELFTKGRKGPNIFTRERQTKLPNEIGFRITAIRETFEESGVLLARPLSDLKDLVHLSSSSHHPFGATYCNIPIKTSMSWRNKIISDPSKFISMCKELEITPDIWSLYEWSNWLTPPLKGSRFDTAFFICCVDEAPLVYDSNETEEGVWLSPSGTLKACAEEIVALAPPQIYELSRLKHFTNIDELLSVAWTNSFYRSEQWMPVILQSQDCLIFALPGDDLYPSDPDLTGEVTSCPMIRTETLDELQVLFPHHNRIVLHRDKQMSLYCNLHDLPGYLMPQQFNTTPKTIAV
ncbi:nucleoside diphosphate-linked moiety X motif 19 mitochondrial [Biomphalaria glabrata]|nr:nucleoside diphosphate-linked moiety X motif 19, mitochondrial [Biomphalaria glabrata]